MLVLVEVAEYIVNIAWIAEALVHLPVDLNHLGLGLWFKDAKNLLENLVRVKYCVDQSKHSIS